MSTQVERSSKPHGSFRRFLHNITPQGRREMKENTAWINAQEQLLSNLSPFEDRIRQQNLGNPLTLMSNEKEHIPHGGGGSTTYYRTLLVTQTETGLEIEADVSSEAYDVFHSHGVDGGGMHRNMTSYNQSATRGHTIIELDHSGMVVGIRSLEKSDGGADYNPNLEKLVSSEEELKDINEIAEKTELTVKVAALFTFVNKEKKEHTE